jgi:hypothetical protein
VGTGGEDTGDIDSAIASTARGENHPNKPNTPLGCLSVAGQTNSTHFRDVPSGSTETRRRPGCPDTFTGTELLGRAPIEPRDPVLNA